MPKEMEADDRSFKVERSSPFDVPGGRYINKEPIDAAKKAARTRMEKDGHKHSVMLIKLEETSRYTGTGRGPFYYRVQAVKKTNPVQHTFKDGSTFSSNYDYEARALGDDEVEQFEQKKYGSILNSSPRK